MKSVLLTIILFFAVIAYAEQQQSPSEQMDLITQTDVPEFYAILDNKSNPAFQNDLVTSSDVPELDSRKYFKKSVKSALKIMQKDHVPSAYKLIAQEYGVPPDILYAVALVESRKKIANGTVRPWPWTLNIERKPYFFETKSDAVRALNKYLATGKQSVAVGPMQMYWRWHKNDLINANIALDPYHNISLGAAYLRKMYETNDRDWWKAIGRYHIKERNAEEKRQAYKYRKSVVSQLDSKG